MAPGNRWYCGINGAVYSIDQTVLVCVPKTVRTFIVPDTVAIIGMSAFEDCASLERAELPESVTTIQPVAFIGCKALRNITIPDSVTEIGIRAFSGCTSLEKISVPQAARWEDNAFENCPKLRIIRR